MVKKLAEDKFADEKKLLIGHRESKRGIVFKVFKK